MESSAAAAKRSHEESRASDVPAVPANGRRRGLSDHIVIPDSLPEPADSPRHSVSWYLSCIPVADQPDFVKLLIFAAIVTEADGWPEERLRQAFGDEYQRVNSLYSARGGSRRLKANVSTLRRLAGCFQPATVQSVPDYVVPVAAGVESDGTTVGSG